MPKSELLSEYERFLNSLSNKKEKQLYQPFFDAVKAADDAMSALHRRDKYGRIPQLKAENRDTLMRLLETLGVRAEALIADQAVSEVNKDAVKKIAALAANNYRHLRNYNPNEARSLPELLEDARTLTLDTRGVDLEDQVGGNQNQRQPLTFLDDNGRTVVGVFTPKRTVNVWENYASVIETLVQNARKEKEKNKMLPTAVQKQLNPFWDLTEQGEKLLLGFMKKLDTPEGAEILGLQKNADRSEKMAALLTHLVGKRANGYGEALCELIAKLNTAHGENVSADEVNANLGKFAVSLVGHLSDQHGTEILNYLEIAKVKDGARVDNRNAAMNAVAELLNVPNLLAKSAPMKVINKNGNTVEGTFMMQAKGVDVSNLGKDDWKYDAKSLENLDGRALKSIADLQVLDYICGNTDRHGANIRTSIASLAASWNTRGMNPIRSRVMRADRKSI